MAVPAAGTGSAVTWSLEAALALVEVEGGSVPFYPSVWIMVGSAWLQLCKKGCRVCLAGRVCHA